MVNDILFVLGLNRASLIKIYLSMGRIYRQVVMILAGDMALVISNQIKLLRSYK